MNPRIVDSFWDLRDDAYDHPDRWRDVTAEEVFQRLAEIVEQVDPGGDAQDWFVVQQRMVAWRSGEASRDG